MPPNPRVINSPLNQVIIGGYVNPIIEKKDTIHGNASVKRCILSILSNYVITQKYKVYQLNRL